MAYIWRTLLLRSPLAIIAGPPSVREEASILVLLCGAANKDHAPSAVVLQDKAPVHKTSKQKITHCASDIKASQSSSLPSSGSSKTWKTVTEKCLSSLINMRYIYH